MWRNLSLAVVLMAVAAGGRPVGAADGPAAIVGPGTAPLAEALAVKEVRRYFYLRTGCLLPVVDKLEAAPAGGAIVVGTKNRPAVQAVLTDAAVRQTVAGLAAEQYVLKTLRTGDRPVVLVAGGDPAGTLYGAYRLAEHLGVRFYLHGDELPDARIAASLPAVDEVGKPLFDRRGIQPFHDFPEGPDWWSTDAYQAILGQLPKLRMNFFGLHTYPEGGVGPEPLVWIGRPADLNADGTVKASYPSRHFTTGNITGAWGYRPTKTADYGFGAAALFDRDDFGADYMRDTQPWNKLAPERQNELFQRMGSVLRDAFTFARQLGIKTCLGTETPLIIPTPVKQRLKAAGQDPADPAVVQEVYQAMFRRIAQTHPLDYYWFWTPEDWTWQAVPQAKVDATLADFKAAHGGRQGGQRPVHTGHLRLGAGPAAGSGAVRHGAAEGHADELHQPAGRAFAGRAGLCQGRGPAEVGHPVDGRRSGDDRPAALGRPDAEGRGGRDGLRLHGPAGNPLADADPGPERVGAGRGRLGPVGWNPALAGPDATAGRQAARGPGRRPARPVQAADRRHRRRSRVPDGAVQRRGLSTWTCPTASTPSR